ncbi:MAG TPA: LysM peptidoglycan-binding domain-containing protein [Anaerolineales bacterium]|nr:LysM peptidoglycan-binding domain-containing protein [Anaerolineales bacterium]
MSKNSLNSLKNRQKQTMRLLQLIIVVLVLLILGLVAFFAYRLVSSNGGGGNLFTTPTSTPTFTPSPIPPTHTLPPSETPTATATFTPTRSGPLEYTIQQGDSLYSIATEFEVDIALLTQFNLDNGIDLINNFIQPGQKILIPPADYVGPTATPIPDNIRAGQVLEVTIKPGDSLFLLAEQYKTTVDAILKANKMTEEDAALLQPGQVLKIPYNVFGLTPATKTPVTPPTRAPTETPLGATAEPATATLPPSTPAPTSADSTPVPTAGSVPTSHATVTSNAPKPSATP